MFNASIMLLFQKKKNVICVMCRMCMKHTKRSLRWKMGSFFNVSRKYHLKNVKCSTKIIHGEIHQSVTKSVSSRFPTWLLINIKFFLQNTMQQVGKDGWYLRRAKGGLAWSNRFLVLITEEKKQKRFWIIYWVIDMHRYLGILLFIRCSSLFLLDF